MYDPFSGHTGLGFKTFQFESHFGELYSPSCDLIRTKYCWLLHGSTGVKTVDCCVVSAGVKTVDRCVVSAGVKTVDRCVVSSGVKTVDRCVVSSGVKTVDRCVVSTGVKTVDCCVVSTGVKTVVCCVVQPEWRLLHDSAEVKTVDCCGFSNCLFRALGDQLEGHSRNHYRHRQEVVKYMMDHRKDFEPFVEDDVPFDDHSEWPALSHSSREMLSDTAWPLWMLGLKACVCVCIRVCVWACLRACLPTCMFGCMCMRNSLTCYCKVCCF